MVVGAETSDIAPKVETAEQVTCINAAKEYKLWVKAEEFGRDC